MQIRTYNPEVNMFLTNPIPLEELRDTISKGKSHKAAGMDGICLELYKQHRM